MKTKVSQPQIGDHVEFTARGRKLTGIIINIRIKQRRGRARQLAELITGNPYELDRTVMRIVPDGTKSWWEVDFSSPVKVLGKATTKQLNTAKLVDADIQQDRQERTERKSESNYKASSDEGLYHLNDGDSIEVKFNDIGWAPATFKGIIKGSGNIRYERFGRLRTSPAKFVRVGQPTS